MVIPSQQNELSFSLERYELKYLIPSWLVEPISDFLSPYCSLDKYSENSDDGYYPVKSLYFDTPGYLFLKKRRYGAASRINMRVRAYGDAPGQPVFFEVKHKINHMVKKYRTPFFGENWPDILNSPDTPWDGLMYSNLKTGPDLFIRLSHSYDATPKILTQYRRKAYFSTIDDYARVTFDRDLQCQIQDEYKLTPDTYGMSNYDDASTFDPETGVILELKCYCANVPLWMLDLIRHFNLKRGRFSKYAAAMETVFLSMGYSPCDRVASFDISDADDPVYYQSGTSSLLSSLRS